MDANSRLHGMIRSHWLTYRPQMVAELRTSGQLEQAIREAETCTADLLYELLSVRKLPYQEAWELATREWAFPPTEDPRSAVSCST